MHFGNPNLVWDGFDGPNTHPYGIVKNNRFIDFVFVHNHRETSSHLKLRELIKLLFYPSALMKHLMGLILQMWW